jgi:hypothetical protein
MHTTPQQMSAWQTAQSRYQSHKQKKADIRRYQPKCHTLTDYRTIVEDFYKVAEFVEWLKEYYPEKIPLIIESK